MTDKLKQLCDMATEAHERVQAQHQDIDPIIGVNQKLRDAGFGVDVMTMDCLKNGKRIIVLLDDAQADLLQYQFLYRDTDPDHHFESIPFQSVTATTLYQWMSQYFSEPAVQ